GATPGELEARAPARAPGRLARRTRLLQSLPGAARPALRVRSRRARRHLRPRRTAGRLALGLARATRPALARMELAHPRGGRPVCARVAPGRRGRRLPVLLHRRAGRPPAPRGIGRRGGAAAGGRLRRLARPARAVGGPARRGAVALPDLGPWHGG